jgi:iron complex transport system permease protein
MKNTGSGSVGVSAANISIEAGGADPKRAAGRRTMLLVMAFLPLAAFTLSFMIGRYPIHPAELFRVLIGHWLGLERTWPETLETVLFNVRLPRILCALMIGAALASSGVTYQGIFRNPMVSPDILGAAAGAGFGAALAILLSFGVVGIELMSFAFGLLAVLITTGVSRFIGKGGEAAMSLVLTGMVVQSLFSAFTSMAKFVADPNNKLPEITFWLMGGLSSVGRKEAWMLMVPFAIGTVPLLMLSWKMNVLAFGDEEAQALGLDTMRIRAVLIVSSTLLTSAAIAVAGMVGWIGLIIPHVVRLLLGPNHRVLLPASICVGGAFMVLIDGIARTAFPLEIPLGILTAIIGAPFFLYLLMKGRTQWR